MRLPMEPPKMAVSRRRVSCADVRTGPAPPGSAPDSPDAAIEVSFIEPSAGLASHRHRGATIPSPGGGGLQQRDAIAHENLVDLRLVAANPLIERALPLLVREAHAHRHLVVKADLRVRL